MKNGKKVVIKSAIAGILSGGLLISSIALAKSADAKGYCYGANQCKGQSACKSKNSCKNACSGPSGCKGSMTKNACKGQNACKGKGFLETTKAECDKLAAKDSNIRFEKK